MVAGYVERLSSSQALFLTDYIGLNVAAITDLRIRLREVDGGYQVVKNTLFKLALEQAGLELPEQSFEGPLAVGYSFKEVPPVAKVLVDFGRESQTLKVLGALLGGNYLDEGGVKTLANLPPREILLAQLLSALQGPLGNLISTLTAPQRELVQVLKARAEQAEEAAA
jgi:large subunit ribosomal protein L10